jgi:hypothetical protein
MLAPECHNHIEGLLPKAKLVLIPPLHYFSYFSWIFEGGKGGWSILLFVLLTALKLNGTTSYLGYVSLGGKFSPPLSLVPLGPFLGCVPFSFRNEACLPLRQKNEKIKKRMSILKTSTKIHVMSWVH